MSKTRWAISLCLVWHLVATALAAIPPPDEVPSPKAPRQHVDDPLARHLTPALDTIAVAFAPLPGAVWDFTKPFRRASNLYTRSTALAQRWNMFWVPTTSDDYARVRYYVRASDESSAHTKASWVATELVFPAHREDRVRLVSSYAVKHRDRAIDSAFARFHLRMKARTMGPDTRPKKIQDNLAPIARFFARRFGRDHLLPNERIARVEVWFGTAPIPPRGQPADAFAKELRQQALNRYYEGLLVDRSSVASFPPYGALEREADISWILEYFEEP